ncbi:MAG: diacylglycerol kinase family protein [Bacteroidales bacterium]|nr:diacylglycerol kinase family protein [Bacteroidales bacterium]
MLFKERNFTIQFSLGITVVIVGFVLDLNKTEWLIILLSIAIILSLEAINSAIETLCNLIQPDYHPMIKKIKDISAGSVLISAILVAVVGLIIFLPKIVALIN